MSETANPRPVYKPSMSGGLKELCDHYQADVKWLESEIKRLRNENADLNSCVTVLSPEAWEKFMDILGNPLEPTEALRKEGLQEQSK